MDTCSQCGEHKRVCWFRGKVWCLDCRRIEVDKQAPLSVSTKVRREFPIEIAGKTYRFSSKAEARRTARAILKRKRLPTEIVRQITQAVDNQ